MPRLLAVVFALALAGALSGAAPATQGPAGARDALVTGVVAGDTIEVRLADGQRERVGLVGVVAPERGGCFAAQANAEIRRLTAGRRIRLLADRAGWSRDRAGRLLAYVALPGGADLGLRLVRNGFGQIDAWGREFSRFTSYVPAQQEAERLNRGLWAACAADVSVALETSQATSGSGARITYRATVANAGPLPASRIRLELRPQAAIVGVEPGGASCATKSWLVACSFAVLEPGAAASVSLVVEVAGPGAVVTRAVVGIDACLRMPCGEAPVHDANPRNDETAALTTPATPPPPQTTPAPTAPATPTAPAAAAACHPSYPRTCIPPPPPDLDCADIPYREFPVKRDLPDPDPHVLDRNEDGLGCQFDDY